MQWILDHVQFIAIVAGVIAYYLNQRRREKQGEDADYDGDSIPDNRQPRRSLADPRNPDPEVAERERRIREEMIRKIAERRGGASPSPSAPPPPLPSKPATPQRRVLAGPVEAPRPASGNPLEEMLRRAVDAARRQEESVRAEATAAENAERERQRRLHEQQLRALEEKRRAELARAEAIARAATPIRSPVPEADRGALLQDLRGSRNLRRAMVLREVLGPPVGLSRR